MKTFSPYSYIRSRLWEIVNGIFVMDISSGFRSFINAISLLAGVVEWNK